MKITASATIERGAKTNRVRVKRPVNSAGRALRRYKQDPLVRGLETAVTAISLPVGELADLDAVCERVQMARSHFIRQAVKHFAAFVLSGGEQGRRWKESTR